MMDKTRMVPMSFKQAGGVIRVDWSPGNGSRYRVLLKRLDAAGLALDREGVPEGSYLVVTGWDDDLQATILVGNDGYLTCDYLAGKLKLDRPTDVSCLAMMIGAILNRPVTVRVDERGEYQPHLEEPMTVDPLYPDIKWGNWDLGEPLIK
jgi:hypothetical protein